MKAGFLINRINKLLKDGSALFETRKETIVPDRITRHNIKVVTVDQIGMGNFRLQSLSFIEKIYGNENLYYTTFSDCSNTNSFFALKKCVGILESIKEEIESGWLNELKDLVSADIFCDFLEMGKYFLDEKYKDAAAVIIGSVLEKHLKNVAERNQIELFIEKDGKSMPKKISLINDELYKESIYNQIVHKSIIHIFSIRNEAAHGNYYNYELRDVENMYNSVNQILIQTN